MYVLLKTSSKGTQMHGYILSYFSSLHLLKILTLIKLLIHIFENNKTNPIPKCDIYRGKKPLILILN